MPQRPDKILHDITSEPYGGSAYHHFNLHIGGGDVSACWIAPRKVRIINARAAQTAVLSGATTPVLSKGNSAAAIASAANIGNAATANRMSRAVTLSTASSVGGLEDVVIPQYEYVSLTNTGQTGGNITVMAHYSFED